MEESQSETTSEQSIESNLEGEYGTDGQEFLEDESLPTLEYEEEDFISEPTITVSKQSAYWIVISIHISCALSRPGSSITGESFLTYLSLVSWLIYALLVPGLVVLFNRRKGAIKETDLLLIPAISLSWIIILGLIVQSLGWLFGISNPLQWWTAGYISLLLSGLLTVNYYNRPQREQSISLSFEKPSFSIILASSIVLILSICGPLILNQSEENYVSMTAILFISILPILVNRGGVAGDYIAIYSCSLSLILTHSLVSNGITGGDIQLEYFWANKVIEDGSIDLLSSNRYSTILSTQIILPILTMWTGTNLTVVLKIVYPLIYSFTPLLLYFSYSQVFERKTSFYAALLSPFCFQFYISMTNMPRQGIAEIFLLTAICILYASDSLRMYRLRIFVVPFLIMMTLAHYGTPILLYPLLWTSYLSLVLINLSTTNRSSEQSEGETIQTDFSSDDEEILSFQIEESALLDEEGIATMEELQNRVIESTPLLNFRQLLLGSIFVLLWHAFAGGGVMLDIIRYIFGRVFDAIQERGILRTIFSTQPSETVTTVLQPFHELTKLLYLLLTTLSLIAILKMIRKENMSRREKNAISLAIGSWILAGLVFTVPLLALYFEFNRVYHWILMFLAPFMIRGLEDSLDYAKIRLNRDVSGGNHNLLGIVLCIYLLLSSGFVYQLTDEDHRMALDSEVEWARFSESEESAIIWYNSISQNPDERQCVWSDYHNSRIFLRYQGQKSFDSIPAAKNANMFYLDKNNLEEQEVWVFNRSGFERWSLSPVKFQDLTPYPNFESASKVYDSGGSYWFSRTACSIEESYLIMEW